MRRAFLPQVDDDPWHVWQRPARPRWSAPPGWGQESWTRAKKQSPFEPSGQFLRRVSFPVRVENPGRVRRSGRRASWAERFARRFPVKRWMERGPMRAVGWLKPRWLQAAGSGSRSSRSRQLGLPLWYPGSIDCQGERSATDFLAASWRSMSPSLHRSCDEKTSATARPVDLSVWGEMQSTRPIEWGTLPIVLPDPCIVVGHLE